MANPSELSHSNFAFADVMGKDESPKTQEIIDTLGMQKHIEGGYFVETDRDPLIIPNPFFKNTSSPGVSSGTNSDASSEDGDEKDLTRNASTSIFYLITPSSPIGHFHRNKGRTVHTLHQGRAVYVLIHADRPDVEGRCEVETFVVGRDVKKGEKLQWIVEGGKFKASFLLDGGEGVDEGGCLISETVVPGFEYKDHDFLGEGMLENLVTKEQAELMDWLVRKE